MYIFIIIWICFFLSEILLLRIFRSKAPASKELDKSSLKFVWVTIIISISVGVLAMTYVKAPISRAIFIGYLGLFIIICGIFIRFSAIRTLGKFFTVNLAIHDNQRLIKSGLYKYIRHPSYTGSLLSFLGLGVSFNNWISLLIIIIPVLISFIYRINIEEQLMLELFGEEYSEYKKSSRRLIPLIY